MSITEQGDTAADNARPLPVGVAEDLNACFIETLGAIKARGRATEADILALVEIAEGALALAPAIGPWGFCVRCETKHDRDVALSMLGRTP